MCYDLVCLTLSIFLQGRRVFGVPLRLNVQRHGRALPRAILQAMDYLRENGEASYLATASYHHLVTQAWTRLDCLGEQRLKQGLKESEKK